MGFRTLVSEYNVNSQLVRFDHGHLRVVGSAPQHRCDK